MANPHISTTRTYQVHEDVAYHDQVSLVVLELVIDGPKEVPILRLLHLIRAAEVHRNASGCVCVNC